MHTVRTPRDEEAANGALRKVILAEVLLRDGTWKAARAVVVEVVAFALSAHPPWDAGGVAV